MRERIFIPILFLSVLPLRGSEKENVKLKKPNVLFICIDDLRRELGCYGSLVKTPNIDRLAGEGSLFFNHYVQVPTSGASRASMLTGHLPRKRADITNDACKINLSDKPEGIIPETMFHQLRRNGYYTVGIGKVSHHPDGYLYGYNEKKNDKRELPYSWDEMLFNPGKWGTGWNAFFGYSDGENRQSRNKMVKPYECADVDDNGFPDGLTADMAVKKIKELSEMDKPFCLAVGFFKPHLPFTSPKKYWDMYDEDSISVPPMKEIPVGCNLSTLHNSSEFNGYKLGEEKASLSSSVSDAYAKKLRHAYYSCISYIDAQVGKLLNALDETGKAENTIIILWGDHGWHLGDMRVWGKHTLHEPSLASALIVKAPGYKKNVRNKRIVSSIDIYPTLMELCGIDKPDGLDGKSFVELLNSPECESWNDVAFSFFNNGASMRNNEYRALYYRKGGNTIKELYRYSSSNIEQINIADKEPAIINSMIMELEKYMW